MPLIVALTSFQQSLNKSLVKRHPNEKRGGKEHMWITNMVIDNYLTNVDGALQLVLIFVEAWQN